MRFTDFFTENKPVQAFSQAITTHNKQLIEKFDPQQSPQKLLFERADFIDEILSSCWQHFFNDSPEVNSLVATGGYGRRELFPHSDIDIAILLKQAPDSQLQQALSNFNNFLWDIGLKPGLSVRTVEECITEAKKDQTIMTSLMEMRLICGNQTLALELEQALKNDQLWPSEDFFMAKMDEQKKRYAKFHDTAYNLEPNIKEGPGGLRDLQIISWVFKHHYHSKTLRELIKYQFISSEEYEELISARDVLWRLRFALHSLTNRPEDRLLFDYQRDLAAQFGFINAKQQSDVEQFMQFFFKTVVKIEQLNEMLLQLFSERFIKQNQVRKVIPITAEFSAINGYLQVTHDNVFTDNPLTLLEIFLLQQQIPSIKGIRASTIRLIRKSLHLIDDDFRQNPQANRLFLSFFRQPKGLTHQLRLMNRYGILAAYLPCFANIVARMQYDLFHIYTVDQHTLFLIRNLRRFALNKHNNELPFCNNIFMLIAKPELLYLAGFFHDIAKGKGGDHSVLGEIITADFCKQHHIPDSDAKLITWLVRNHLLMSVTAQKKDISDPQVIHDFAQRVGSIKNLNYLYLLTVADIRATNPSLWNSWKDSLLKDLYIATHSALHRGLDNPVNLTEILTSNQNEALNELRRLGLSEERVYQCWQHLDEEDYFIRYSPDEIAWHTMAIATSSPEEFPLVLLRPQNQRGSAEIFIYGPNKKSVFAICTATLDSLGLTILDARIITTENQHILNSFQILEQSGEAIKDISREIEIASILRQNLLENKIPEQTGFHRLSRQARYFPIKTRLSFLPDTSNRFTILEVVTTDQAGLLTIISQAFRKFNCHIHDAKITTIGSRVEDVFYLTDDSSKPIENEETLNQLKDYLYNTLEKKQAD